MAHPELHATLVTGIQSPWDDQDSADTTVKCRDRVFHVHRTILLLSGGFLAGLMRQRFKERETGVIELDEHDPQVVALVLRFIYGFEYTWAAAEQPGLKEKLADLELHTKMYAAADFFQLPVLKDYAKYLFDFVAGMPAHEEEDWDGDESIMSVDSESSGYHETVFNENAPRLERDRERAAKRHEPLDEDFAEACLKVAHLVYTSTPDIDRGLRDTVTAVLDWNISRLLASEENRSIFDSVPGLATDVLAMRTKLAPTRFSFGRAADQTRCKCPDCGYMWAVVKSETTENMDPGKKLSCHGCERSHPLSMFMGAAL